MVSGEVHCVYHCLECRHGKAEIMEPGTDSEHF